MKKILFIISLLSLAQFSCKKADSCSPAPTSLEGKWRMVIVSDNLSGSSTTKAASIKGDVEIVFTPTSPTTGSFSGNTPSNTIQPNAYSTGSNHTIVMPVLYMTKVAETSWGNEFVDNIRSAQEYNFEKCGILKIKTASKMLSFQKL
jgi:hypothetical protein